MIQKLIQNKYRIAIILTIFLLYLLNGIGVFDISYRNGLDVSFNERILVSVLVGTLSSPMEIESISLLLMLVTGLILAIGLPLLSPIAASILTVVISLPHIYIYLMSTDSHLILPMEYNILIILILFSMNALIIYFMETHSHQKIINLFGQYVPPAIVTELSKHPDSWKMEGESRRMTVFFSDLQDFSNVAEQLNPKQLGLLLNEYFDGMTEILYRYGATIDKYIGDSIMAFWGAPLPQADHAQRSVLAALDMSVEIKHLSESFVSRGWPGPRMGIGINTGMMNVGNMGSRYRVAYTVIGDAVNLASRIEALTRRYRVPVLVSEATRNDCPDIAFREIDTVQVKGKYNRTRIYQPLCRLSELDDGLKANLALHEQGMAAYNSDDLGTAISIFRDLQSKRKKDPYYEVMLRKLDSEKRGATPNQ